MRVYPGWRMMRILPHPTLSRWERARGWRPHRDSRHPGLYSHPPPPPFPPAVSIVIPAAIPIVIPAAIPIVIPARLIVIPAKAGIHPLSVAGYGVWQNPS